MTLIDATLARVAQILHDRGVHPARAVVLLPFAQLLPLCAQSWGERFPSGFMPRFVTTQSWARQVGVVEVSGDDFRFDLGLDTLTARRLLGFVATPTMQTQVSSLASMLVQACAQVAGVAASIPPDQRGDWAARLAPMLSLGMDGPSLQAEHTVMQLALGWAGSSRYATDVLWTAKASGQADVLVMVAGLQADPLADALVQAWGERALRLEEGLQPSAGATLPALHPCEDFEDEAQTSAAWVLHHHAISSAPIAATPIAVVATDRVLTRRIRALLDASGVAVRDETGWKLSTTRAAANVISSLDACAHNASTDAVLDWLKNCPAADARQVRRLEAELRRARCRFWQGRQLVDIDLRIWVETWVETRAKALHDPPQEGPCSLHTWCAALARLLSECGLWTALEQDKAGAAVLQALHLTPAAQAALQTWPQAQQHMGLHEFTTWCKDALEAASFVPEPGANAQVVILPLSQMLGRSFSAVVMPGCDEVRLNPAPDMPGLWLPAHRQALGLPTRDAAQASLRLAWQQAAERHQVHVLWRRQGPEGEPLQLSPLVQRWMLAHEAHEAHDQGVDQAGSLEVPEVPEVRRVRRITASAVKPPTPRGASLPIQRLSASAYADLRQCPYKFFALRQLRLSEASELDLETEKRDFGDWLHAVLKIFHEEHAAHAWPEAQWPAELDRIAQDCREERLLGAAEFLPFAAAWPRLRDGYLRWWAQHQTSTGLHFASAETAHDMGLGPLSLYGRIDRIDVESTDEVMVLDYKTESLARSKERVRTPLEDTQITFYAALLPHDSLRAGYINVGEADGTQLVEQTDVVAARDALIQGIQDDLQSIQAGAVLAALGEGEGCDYCAARGLCRKDHWETV